MEQKKNRNNKWYWIGGAVLLLLIVAVAIKNRKTEKGISVQTEKASLRTIVESVEASGKVFPKTEVKISSDVSGQIVELFVNEGDSVTKGQVLARVDPEAYQSQVERAAAGVNSAKSAVANSRSQLQSAKAQKEQIEAQLMNARDIHRRNEKLYKEGVISEQEYEASLANVRTLEANLRAAEANIKSAEEGIKAAEFQVRSAEATLKEISTSLKRTTIYASMSGIVSKLNVEKGERVVGTSMMAGTEILRIADLSAMEIQVEVPENDLPRIELGQEVQIEIDAYLDRKFKGKVVEIAHSANNLVSATGSVNLTSEQVTNFVITIDIEPSSYADLVKAGKPYPFRPGMSAFAKILTNTKENIVSVPIQAVSTREPKELEKAGKARAVSQSDSSLGDDFVEVVFVVEEGDTVNMVEVKTGIQDDEYIEIVSGVSEGQEVVTGPYSAVSKKLKQGDKIKRDNEKKEGEEAEEE
ncbi:MAG: HlyD family efflux transporter periplasmic adaptor subunit [Bacteroidetes bacterium]|nr:MAG: HlyD family efflux transporter periplasmic adaptor subunit [Bacteroidota bacterium]